MTLDIKRQRPLQAQGGEVTVPYTVVVLPLCWRVDIIKKLAKYSPEVFMGAT